MRSALRGATVTVAAAGLVMSSFALVGPLAASSASAATPGTPGTPRASSWAGVSLVSTPYVGRGCVVAVRVTSNKIGLANQTLTLQIKEVRKGEKWSTYKKVKSVGGTGSVKITRKASDRPVSFRVLFAGSSKYKPATSKVVTCTPKSLKYGVKASSVKDLQRKLKNLRIRPAFVNGKFDNNTLEAVYAYQKSKGLPRTGVVDGKLYERIMATKKMSAPSWCTTADTICIDIGDQVAYLKAGSGNRYTFPVSSGGGYYYYQDGVRNFAKTPIGTYHVYYKVPGATTGPLGTYYWISFFTGGYGVHGSASVPTYPASHGCVRVPRSIEQWVYKNLPVGSQVHLHK